MLTKTRRNPVSKKPKSFITKCAALEWKRRWKNASRDQSTTTRCNLWADRSECLYEGILKHLGIALIPYCSKQRLWAYTWPAKMKVPLSTRTAPLGSTIKPTSTASSDARDMMQQSVIHEARTTTERNHSQTAQASQAIGCQQAGVYRRGCSSNSSWLQRLLERTEYQPPTKLGTL